MTESDWLQSFHFNRLLESLPIRLTERRWRLLACGICRQVGPSESDTDLLSALTTAEAFADGKRTARQLATANRKATRRTRSRTRTALQSMGGWNQADDPDDRSEWYFRAQVDGRLAAVAYLIAQAAATSVQSFYRRPQGHTPDIALLARFTEMLLDEQAGVIHDLVGNPFRRPTIDPDWLAWRDGFIGHLARDIYDHQRWEDVPILGDALEDAGCTDKGILNHCHGKGLHVRGCWVVDRLVGRVPGPRAFHSEVLVRHYPERYCTPLESVIGSGNGPGGSKVHLLMESANLANAVEFVSEIDPTDLPDTETAAYPAALAAVIAGVRARLLNLAPRGRPLAGVRLTLLHFRSPAAAPLEESIQDAVGDAIGRAVNEAVMVPLEVSARGRLPR